MRSSSNNESNHIVLLLLQLLLLSFACCFVCALFASLFLSCCLLFHMTGKFVMLFMLLSFQAVDCQLFVAVAVSVDFFFALRVQIP